MFNKKNENQCEVDFIEAQEQKEIKRHNMIQGIKDAILIIAVVAIIVILVWFHDNEKGQKTADVGANEIGTVVVSNDCPADMEGFTFDEPRSEEEAAYLESVKVAIWAAESYAMYHPNMNKDEEEMYRNLVFCALTRYSEYMQIKRECYVPDMYAEEEFHRDDHELPMPEPPVAPDTFIEGEDS